MNTEALDVIYGRRSIRRYKITQIEDSDLDAVLKAGMYAPTGKGTQEPVIVVVQDEDTRNRVSKLNASINGNQSDPYYGAPTIIIVFASEDAYGRDISIMDCSAVMTNMLNAAYACGLGSCWINRPMAMFKTVEGKTLLKEWGLSENLMGVASMALGYADCDLPVPAKRKENYVVKI